MIIDRIVANGHGRLTNRRFLAIHSTANAGATAANHVNYWRNNPKYAVHLVSDWMECFHTVPYDRLCYQVGNGNNTCVGIEICEATNERDFMRGMEVARQAILEVLPQIGLTVDDMRSHLWFTQNYGGSDHTDPIPYLKRFGKDWDWFVNFIRQGMTQETEHKTKRRRKMECIFRPNGEGRLVYYDGVKCHSLEHPDEVTAIQMVYRSCNDGADIPIFELGSPQAPWATRFIAATER